MAAPVDPGNFTDHTPALADAVDARFAPLFTVLNGNLDDGNLGVDIPTPELLTPIAWQSVATTGAIPDGGGTFEFFKDHLGFVRVKGKRYDHAGAGSQTAGATFCTIPAGYRPGVTSYMRVTAGTHPPGFPASFGSACGYLTVNTNGVITVGASLSWSSGFHSLLGFWLAEG